MSLSTAQIDEIMAWADRQGAWLGVVGGPEGEAAARAELVEIVGGEAELMGADAGQVAAFLAWRDAQVLREPTTYSGPIGGRFSVTFVETSIGQVVTAKDHQTGETLDLSGDL